MNNGSFDTFLLEQLEQIKESNRIRSGDIPNIDLYMDQVTTFMDDHLGLFKRNDNDKILTKTMINNYSKYNLLPPTVKKKYTNDHIILMLFIYYLKPILSITDIKELLAPIRDMFSKDDQPSDMSTLKDFHDRILESETANFHIFEERMQETIQIAKEMFTDVEDDDKRELFSIFATSYLFTIQASAQKHMITRLIDDYLLKQYPDVYSSKGTGKPAPKVDRGKTEKA